MSNYSGDFICKRFESFLDALDYNNRYHKDDRMTTILPVCKFTPTFLHTPILSAKLWYRFITVKRIDGGSYGLKWSICTTE